MKSHHCVVMTIFLLVFCLNLTYVEGQCKTGEPDPSKVEPEPDVNMTVIPSIIGQEGDVVTIQCVGGPPRYPRPSFTVSPIIDIRAGIGATQLGICEYSPPRFGQVRCNISVTLDSTLGTTVSCVVRNSRPGCRIKTVTLTINKRKVVPRVTSSSLPTTSATRMKVPYLTSSFVSTTSATTTTVLYVTSSSTFATKAAKANLLYVTSSSTFATKAAKANQLSFNSSLTSNTSATRTIFPHLIYRLTSTKIAARATVSDVALPLRTSTRATRTVSYFTSSLTTSTTSATRNDEPLGQEDNRQNRVDKDNDGDLDGVKKLITATLVIVIVVLLIVILAIVYLIRSVKK